MTMSLMVHYKSHSFAIVSTNRVEIIVSFDLFSSNISHSLLQWLPSGNNFMMFSMWAIMLKDAHTIFTITQWVNSKNMCSPTPFTKLFRFVTSSSSSGFYGKFTLFVYTLGLFGEYSWGGFGVWIQNHKLLSPKFTPETQECSPFSTICASLKMLSNTYSRLNLHFFIAQTSDVWKFFTVFLPFQLKQKKGYILHGQKWNHPSCRRCTKWTLVFSRGPLKPPTDETEVPQYSLRWTAP